MYGKCQIRGQKSISEYIKSKIYSNQNSANSGKKKTIEENET